MSNVKMESRDYLEMSFQSINCFADDGKLDAIELGKIFDIALRDGVVDSNEIRVLHQIFMRLKPEELDKEMLEMKQYSDRTDSSYRLKILQTF